MPKEFFGRDYEFLKRDELLSFEEILRVSKVFASVGVKKIRITGGEPLVRRDIEELIGMLAKISNVDLTLTTNGTLLPEKADSLRRVGLKRVTISLDSLEDDVFKAMNDVDYPVEGVLEGIRAAQEAGLSPIKVNMVVKRGINQDSILPMAKHFRNSGIILRFIEYMDVGTTNGWRLDQVVPAVEIIDIINREYPLEPIDPNYSGEVAKRWRYKDGAGEIGVIASVTKPFCGGCTRIRLSAEGLLYTCLFATQGHDLRTVLRQDASEVNIRTFINKLWDDRQDRYSEIRSSETKELNKVEMSYIGG
jgi:cyclic pyranopterin phosphate synthase